jgi:ribosomal protein S18 acetylase RimI-like enzyme
MRELSPTMLGGLAPEQTATLARIEEAGLNASQPPEQLLYDGWLLRFSAGKARRARSAQALTAGCMPLEQKLDGVCRWYTSRRLPPLVRITPFSRPPAIDAELAARGWIAIETTWVMTRTVREADIPASADALRVERVGEQRFAQCVGELRGSSPAQVDAHARRLEGSPLSDAAVRVIVFDGGLPIAAGQTVVEMEMAGLYDIVTATSHRGLGLADRVCRQLLTHAAQMGAHTAYLQVGADNAAARRLYARLGFTDRYTYWYRRPVAAADELSQ